MRKPSFKARIDYEFKAYVLNNYKDLLDYANKCKRYEYIIHQLEATGEVLELPNSDKELMTIYALRDSMKNEVEKQALLECLKILHANYERVKRLQKRVKAIISQNKSTFLTITFDDKHLTETTAKQRRNEITRFLKQFDAPYIANIDFGIDETKTKREHYHAVIGCQNIDYSKWPYYINGEKIIVLNEKALSKYVSKLSNHAIKEQAKRSSLIYSR